MNQNQRQNQKQGTQTMTKNIQISFRLTPHQLAHGLEILKGLESTYKPSSLTVMVKEIYLDWIAKMSIATKPWPSYESLQAIKQIMAQTAAGRKAIARQNHNQELARIAQEVANTNNQTNTNTNTSNQNNQSNQSNIPTKSELTKLIEKEQTSESITKSISRIVTDFSPPTIEELMNGEQE